MARRLGRPSPDPGLGSMIELSRCHASSLLDLSWIGKALSSQRISPEKPPPALLQIEPACPFGNEDLMEARMLGEPGGGFRAQMTGQVICNHEQISLGILGLNIGKQGDVVLRVT